MNSRVMLDRLLSFQAPGRRVQVLPDDTFLVSYPRSGNVWVRFLIATLRDGHPSDFIHMNAVLPDIYGASRRRLGRLARPRLMKSHEYFDPRYRRVIYLVRDPRDVVVSYHEFQQRSGMIPENYPLNSYVERFVAGGLDRFGTWREHVGSWLGARFGQPDFLLLRYEDLRSDPVAGLRRIADFIGLQANDAGLATAIERCSIAAMREVEQVQAREGVIDRSRLDRPAVGASAQAGWKNRLDQVLAARIAEAFAPVMRDLGYLDGSLGGSSSGAGRSDLRLHQSNR